MTRKPRAAVEARRDKLRSGAHNNPQPKESGNLTLTLHDRSVANIVVTPDSARLFNQRIR